MLLGQVRLGRVVLAVTAPNVTSKESLARALAIEIADVLGPVTNWERTVLVLDLCKGYAERMAAFQRRAKRDR